jgi:glucokinase
MSSSGRSHSNQFIGIDLGKTWVRACSYALVNGRPAGRQRARETAMPISTPQSGATDIVHACAESVADLVRKGAAPVAIGIGTFGLVDLQGGRVIRSGSLPFWNDVPLGDMLSKMLAIPSFVLNDVAATALGIGARRDQRTDSPIVLVQLGTSVGISGWGGHLTPLWERADFGQVSLLRMGGGLILKDRLGGKGLQSTARALIGEDLSPADVFRMAATGNQIASQVVAGYLDGLSTLLASVAALLVPDAIVLQGGITRSLDPLLPRIREQYAGQLPLLLRMPRIEISPFEDAPQLGAAMWACRRWTR